MAKKLNLILIFAWFIEMGKLELMANMTVAVTKLPKTILNFVVGEGLRERGVFGIKTSTTNLEEQLLTKFHLCIIFLGILEYLQAVFDN